MRQDSSVGIATCYGMEGAGIESRWGRDFLHPSRPALRPTSLLYNGYRVLPGGKRPGHGAVHKPHHSAGVKERVKLYLYSLSALVVCFRVKCISLFIYLFMGPGSSVGIATDYGLDGPGSNPGGHEIYRPSRPDLGPNQPPVK